VFHTRPGFARQGICLAVSLDALEAQDAQADPHVVTRRTDSRSQLHSYLKTV